MSVDEYLHTTFDGADREYLDGEVVERNMGNKSHGRLQGWLVRLLGSHEERTGLYLIPEVRHRVQEARYRIPDIAVFEGEPESEIPSTPPLIAIEILSPDDRIGYIVPKLEVPSVGRAPHLACRPGRPKAVHLRRHRPARSERTWPARIRDHADSRQHLQPGLGTTPAPCKLTPMSTLGSSRLR